MEGYFWESYFSWFWESCVLEKFVLISWKVCPRSALDVVLVVCVTELWLTLFGIEFFINDLANIFRNNWMTETLVFSQDIRKINGLTFGFLFFFLILMWKNEIQI